MWPWPLLTSMASLPEHCTCDRGPPCTTHDTSKYAKGMSCIVPAHWPPCGPLTTDNPTPRPTPPPDTPPPPVAVLVMTIFQKGVDAFRNVTIEHSQPKWLNVLQHGIYIMLEAQ